MTSGLVATSIGKFDALALLGGRVGLKPPESHDLQPYFESLAPLGLNANPAFVLADGPQVPERVVFPQSHWTMAGPILTNGNPACFPPQFGAEISPALTLAEIPGGFFVQLARAPITVMADQATISRRYSSRYAPIVHLYDVDLAALLAEARDVPGDALVLCDEIFAPNYCHWLVDTLPRLAAIGASADVKIIVSTPDLPFKRQTLMACGIDEDRIIWIDDFTAVRAERLLVTSDIRHMPHPGHKAASWGLDFLRARFIGPAAPTPRKLYVSRADAAGRRILNDDAMMRLLAPMGYHLVTLSGRAVANQAALFAGATHIVGLHGAGLANVVFCRPGARLLEIFPASYGTPAFCVLAAGAGVAYATYVTAGVESGSRTQVDDVIIDLGDFVRCCGALL